MNKEQAIEIIKAVVCCSVAGLRCIDDCPLWDEEKGRCRPWTDEEAVEAVRTLKGAMKNNEQGKAKV